MKKRKETLIMIIIISILLLGIGYAYITTNLSINGTADVDSNTWNVYWDNVQVTSGSVSGSQVITAPTISNQTTVSFHIRLKEPGELYEFTVDGKNTGTIDAMIDTITTNINNSPTPPEYLKYKVTYGNGSPIENNHLLSVNSTQTYKIRIEYRTDINPSSLPSTAQSLSVTFTTDYIQATSAAVPVVNYIYTTVAGYVISVGQQINSNVAQYTNPYDLTETTGYNYFLRHTINSSNIVEKIDVGFKYEDEVYCFEYGTPYDTVRARLESIFGSSACSFYDGAYRCESENVDAHVYQSSGTIATGMNNEYWCSVYNNGNRGLCWND